jgi:hypothetical protein
MRTYRFNELTATKLLEIAAIHHELPQPDVWEELARREIGERARSALALIIATLRDFKLLLANEALIRIGQLPLLGLLFERVLIPQQVTDELDRGQHVLSPFRDAAGADALVVAAPAAGPFLRRP